MSTDEDPQKQPVRKAQKIGLIAIGAIILVLVIFLVLTHLEGGDTTDHQGRRTNNSAPALVSGQPA